MEHKLTDIERKSDEHMNMQNNKGQKRLSASLDENIALFHRCFGEDTTIKFRTFENQKNSKVRCCILFVDGMINNALINEHVIEPIMLNKALRASKTLLSDLRERVLFSNDIFPMTDVEQMMGELLSGNTILLADGFAEALILSTRGWSIRSISEPAAEKVLQGPREGFTEALIVNLSLLRRKICNPNLRYQFMTIGRQSQTKIALAYMKGIADERIVADMKKRLSSIDIDSILDANYIEEIVKDEPYSPFKTTGSTERPDIVAAKLFEGRVAVLVDGTPVVITAPFFFIEYFQSNDDYYSNFYVGTFGRWLRMAGFLLTLSLPAIYLALVTFHQDLLPTRFLLNLSAARLGLPFPTLFEMILLILVFELIREGGAKIPANFGQTLSIVGGLVLGQAAVEAKLVSIPVVIIIAFTGVTGLMIPQLKSPIIFLRLSFLLLAAFLGFPGFLLGITLLLLHLSSLSTFGIPYTSSLSESFAQESQDTFLRASWRHMILRPSYIAPDNRTRQSPEYNLRWGKG